MLDGSVSHDHGLVAYRDFGGHGPAVMLLHGVGGNLAHWGRVAPLLRQRYRLIAIDLPSHGASTAPAVYSFEHDLAAVDQVRRSLGLHRPAVVGHSYGGMLAIALGTAQPGNYRTLVNVDGVGFAIGTSAGPEKLPEPLPDGDSVNQGDAEWLEAEIRREVSEAAAVGLHLDPDGEMVRRSFQLRDDGLWHSSPTLSRFVEIVRALEARPLIPAYAASSCPTVTVIAEHRYAPSEEEAASTRLHVERVRAALVAAGSKLDTVPSGHYPHVEVPEVVADRFASWVAS